MSREPIRALLPSDNSGATAASFVLLLCFLHPYSDPRDSRPLGRFGFYFSSVPLTHLSLAQQNEPFMWWREVQATSCAVRRKHRYSRIR